MLAPTPDRHLLDSRGRPYYLWDLDLTLEELRARLASVDPGVRNYHLAKLLRQAKPDDALQLVRLDEIAEAWPRIAGSLGKQRDFWAWLLVRRGLHAGADE